MTRKACFLCRTGKVSERLDVGPQPISNRYLLDPGEKEFRHPFVVGQCEVCGLLQIPEPVPAAELRPRFDWITYQEPEGHLDRLAQILAGLPGGTTSSVFCGMSFKDDSLLERMKKLGFKQTWRIQPQEDLGWEDSWAGAETVQDRFGPEAARGIVHRRGKVDRVVARHILEHSHRLDEFVSGLKALVQPRGYIVVELPDCSRALERGDGTTLWEEHILYFTPQTFQRAFSFFGLRLVRLERFPYPLEDSLVGIAQPEPSLAKAFPSPVVLQQEHLRVEAFLRKWEGRRQAFHRILGSYRLGEGKVALLGAGHFSCVFINLMGLKDSIDFVVDDDPHKRGLRMPGSRLPIRDSSTLLQEKVKLCLLGVNPSNQEGVIRRHRPFLQQGGVFLSIFPDGATGPTPIFLKEEQVPCP